MRLTVAAMLLWGSPMPSDADPVVYSGLVISNIGGGWTNVSTGDISALSVANTGATDSIRWGMTQTSWNGTQTSTGGTGQSGYDFTAAAGYDPVPLDEAFLLGTFVHINQPITGSFLSSVDYDFSFTTNGSASPMSTTFSFSHDETLNQGPCAGGVNGPSLSMCDDFVTVSSDGLAFEAMVGTNMYMFESLGFSTDGGLTVTNSFQSPELMTNQAGLYGRITLQSVPEPGTLMLVGMGLAACGLGRRRRP